MDQQEKRHSICMHPPPAKPKPCPAHSEASPDSSLAYYSSFRIVTVILPHHVVPGPFQATYVFDSDITKN